MTETEEVRSMPTSTIVTAIVATLLDPHGSRGIVPPLRDLQAELDARVPKPGQETT